jgi:hypothetical protein
MFTTTGFTRIVDGATRRAVVSVVTPLTTPTLLLSLGSLPLPTLLTIDSLLLPTMDQCTG